MRFLVTVLAILALACATPARAKPIANRAEPTQAETVTPALFLMQDADSTLYIYGTRHALEPGAPWANETVRAALAQAEEVWVESEPTDAARQRAQSQVAQLMATPPKLPLSQRLSAEQFARVQAAGDSIGLHPQQVEEMRPWIMAILFARVLILSAERGPEAGVDQQIVNWANGAGKPVRWLEELTPAHFEALPEAVQIEFLLYCLDDFELGRAGVEAGEALWRNGDLDAMEAQDLAPMRRAYPNLYAWIAVERNNAWVDILAAEMDGAGVDFVAVGVSHLVGPDSLIALLQQRGFAIERVASN